MPASILSIGTAVPPTRLPQDHVRDLFAAQPGLDRLSRRLIHAAFDAAAIDARHTVLEALGTGQRESQPGEDLPVLDDAGVLQMPSTGARNAAFVRLAPPLFAAAAVDALDGAGVAASDVTHVVTVSCTGMFAPGPDYRLVRDLGLPPATERFHLGFVGCAAAMPALRLADALCAARPDAVVLVVCAELCTLHFRPSDDPEQIVAASVFADGAAAAVVSARSDLQSGLAGPRLDLERFGTTVTTDGERDMAWTIGDAGFEMTLTAEVPRIIGREIRDAVGAFLSGDAPDIWAVHPGGRSVLDRVESGLDLPGGALAASRDVLRTHGNMSSATILFILRRLMADAVAGAPAASVAALAFGPGLTVESALLTRHAAPLGLRDDGVRVDSADAEDRVRERVGARGGVR